MSEGDRLQRAGDVEKVRLLVERNDVKSMRGQGRREREERTRMADPAVLRASFILLEHGRFPRRVAQPAQHLRIV